MFGSFGILYIGSPQTPIYELSPPKQVLFAEEDSLGPEKLPNTTYPKPARVRVWRICSLCTLLLSINCRFTIHIFDSSISVVTTTFSIFTLFHLLHAIFRG